MSWIEDMLASLAQRRRQLEAPPADENGPQPAGPAGVFGRMGPQPAADRSQALGLSAGGQAGALIDAYQKYLRRSGNEREPLLESRTRTTRGPGGSGRMEELRPAARLLKAADGSAFSVTQQGPRAGLVAQSYELADGRKAHVYYDERGRRHTFVFGKRS